MQARTLQLRVALFFESAPVYHACTRPPARLSIGSAPSALLPLKGSGVPILDELFVLGADSCLVGFREEWGFELYRGDSTIGAEQLRAEGLLSEQGPQRWLQLAPRSRGALQFGDYRMIFKVEEVPSGPVARITLEELETVPQCHACGKPLDNVLVRSGLLARCKACRAVCQFVGISSPEPSSAPGATSPSEAVDTAKARVIAENAQTLIAAPVFSPDLLEPTDPLEHRARPAGLPGPAPLSRGVQAAQAPLRALEGMKTHYSSAEFFDPEDSRSRAELDEAFYSSEHEALEPLPHARSSKSPSPSRAAESRGPEVSGEPRAPARPRDPARPDAAQRIRPGQWLAGLAFLVAVLLLGIYLGKAHPPADAPSTEGGESLRHGDPGGEADAEPSGSGLQLAVVVDRVAHPDAGAIEGFSIDRYEVSVRDFERFLEVSGRAAPGGWSIHRPSSGSRLPATGVSAEDAQAYCSWTGSRLPAEREWTRAAAGLAGRSYPWGDDFDPERLAMGEVLEEVSSRPSGASEAGVHGLLGGAPEWVTVEGSEPLLKGGGVAPWNKSEYLTIGARIPPGAERWSPGPGFRCALSLAPPGEAR